MTPKPKQKKKGPSSAEIIFACMMFFIFYVFLIKPTMNKIYYNHMQQLWLDSYTKMSLVTKNMTSDGTRLKAFVSNESGFLDEYSKYLNPVKTCTDAKKEGCWHLVSDWDSTDKPGIILNNGAFIVPVITSSSCEDSSNTFQTCGYFVVDINGKKEPNKIGIDILKINILQDDIKPAGIKGDIVNPASKCQFGTVQDWGCSAKYMDKI